MTNLFDEKAPTWDQHQDRILRAQTLAKIIKAKLPDLGKMRVLDFGCGTGLLGLEFLADALHVSFADTSAGMIDQLAQKLPPGARATVIPLAHQGLPTNLDLIVSLQVLHHIEDHGAAIKTLVNLLNPGGYLCLCDLDREDGSFHQDETVPHQGFDRQEILGLCEKYGLTDLGAQTGFINRKRIQGVEREYPVFLVMGKKP